MNVNELTDMPVRETKIAGIPLTVRLMQMTGHGTMWYAFLLGGIVELSLDFCYYPMVCVCAQAEKS